MGQALVEFALVLPIAVIILAAIIQFASIFERQIGIENAIREDARAAAALPTDNSNASSNANWAFNRLFNAGGLLESNVQGYSAGSLGNISVCYDNGPADPSGNGQILVTVTITYMHPLFVPIISGILDGIDNHTDGTLWVTSSVQFHDETAEDTSVSLAGPYCST
jgi:Flp pilus assembly protein TadG